MTTTVITDLSHGLIIHPRSILTILDRWYGQDVWHIYELDCCNFKTLDYHSTLAAIEVGEYGMRVSFSKLVDICEDCVQISDAIFAVPKYDHNLPQPPVTRKFLDNCKVVVVAFDSSQWEVSTDTSEVHATLADSFKSTIVLP